MDAPRAVADGLKCQRLHSGGGLPRITSMAAGQVSCGDGAVRELLTNDGTGNTMVLPGWICGQGDVVEGRRSAEALVWE